MRQPRLCRWHHHLKTYDGYRLEGGPGQWRWVAPADARAGPDPPWGDRAGDDERAASADGIDRGEFDGADSGGRRPTFRDLQAALAAAFDQLSVRPSRRAATS